MGVPGIAAAPQSQRRMPAKRLAARRANLRITPAVRDRMQGCFKVGAELTRKGAQQFKSHCLCWCVQMLACPLRRGVQYPAIGDTCFMGATLAYVITPCHQQHAVCIAAQAGLQHPR